MTSRTTVASSGSTAYSHITWNPRRATFSVRLERRGPRTLTRWAQVAATSRGTRPWASWVSSTAKTIAVKGERVTPASAPPSPMRAQLAGVDPGRT